MRPIVSNAGSVLEGLSKWIDFHLQPYMKKSSTYLRDSDELLKILSKIKPTRTQKLITFDVVALYTNVDYNEAKCSIEFQLSEDTTIPDKIKVKIMEGLDIIMKNNYFTFGNTQWRQKHGTAMGTPCAPSYVNTYLSTLEEIYLKGKYNNNITLFKRFIDDGLLIWDDKNDSQSFYSFITDYERATGMKFTYDVQDIQVAFLDLWIIKESERYITRTHQKKMNLYLYLPANSAHPPSIIRGMVVGLLGKYRKQNTLDNDFNIIMNLLYRRLIARGYKRHTLEPLFLNTIKFTKNDQEKEVDEKIYLKIRFDPNGPTRRQIISLLKLRELSEELDVARISICYLRAPTIGKFLYHTLMTTYHFQISDGGTQGGI